MKNVLITGGTSGIGYELARCFAKNKYGVILVSSNINRLNKSKELLETEYHISIRVYEQDLSQVGGAKELFNKVKKDNLSVDVLVNNAGYGLAGPTEEIDFIKDEKLMILNDINLVELCKLFLPDMYSRKQGKILNISSTGAFQPGPYTSTYFASKAFVLSYSRGIRYEAKKRGVSVSILCPGATKTNFFKQEGKDTPASAMLPEKVANYAYKGLMRNKEIIIPGMINKLIKSLVPTRIKMNVVAKMKGNN